MTMVRKLLSRYFRLIRPAAPTIRFMLVIAGGVCFALAASGYMQTEGVTPDRLNALGLLLICATILFIDPENPPGPHTDTGNMEDAVGMDEPLE